MIEAFLRPIAKGGKKKCSQRSALQTYQETLLEQLKKKPSDKTGLEELSSACLAEVFCAPKHTSLGLF